MVLSGGIAALLLTAIIARPHRGHSDPEDNAELLGSGLITVMADLDLLYDEVLACQEDIRCLQQLQQDYEYFRPSGEFARVTIRLQGWASRADIRRFARDVHGELSIRRVSYEQDTDETLLHGWVWVRALWHTRNKAEEVFAVAGLYQPITMPVLNVQYVTSETWFLPTEPDPAANDCWDPSIHHAYYTPGGHIDELDREYIEGSTAMPPAIVWPPTAGELAQQFSPFIPLPQGGEYSRTTVIEDLAVCKHYNNPFSWCASQTYDYDDFVRIYEDDFELNVHEPVEKDALDPAVAEWFSTYFSDLQSGIIGGDFAELEVTLADRPVRMVAWMEDTRATSIRELYDQNQMIVLKWNVFVASSTVILKPLWYNDNTNQHEPYLMESDPTQEAYFALELPEFQMELTAGYQVDAWLGDVQMHLEDFGGISPFLVVQHLWTQVDSANIKPFSTPAFLYEYVAHVDQQRVDILQGYMGNQGNDAIEPGALPLAIAETLEPSLFDLGFDMGQFLSKYTYFVNPIYHANEVEPSSRRFLGVGPAQGTQEYVGEDPNTNVRFSDCPLADPVEVPPHGRQGDIPEWDYTAGFAVVSQGTHWSVPGTQQYDYSGDWLRGTAAWMSVTSADLQDSAVFDKLAILQDVELEENPFGNPDLDDPSHEDLVVDLFLETMDIGLERLEKQDCTEHYLDQYGHEAIDCDALCHMDVFDNLNPYLADNDLDTTQREDCRHGCQGYLYCSVREQFMGLCAEPAYTLYVPPKPGVPETCLTAHSRPDGDSLREFWISDYDENDIDQILKAAPQRQKWTTVTNQGGGCNVGFILWPDYVDMPFPYFRNEGGATELRVPAWADLYVDICLPLDYAADATPHNDNEKCPGREPEGEPDDGGTLDDFYDVLGEDGSVTVCGTLKVEMNLEWVFSMQTARRWQWTGGWRGRNTEPNDAVVGQLQNGTIDLSTFDWNDFARDYAMTGLEIGFGGACFGEPYDDNGDGTIDDDEIFIENDPAYRISMSNITADGGVAGILEGVLYEQLKHPCDNDVVNWIRGDQSLEQAVPQLNLPFFDEMFYNFMDDSSPGVYQAALVYSFEGHEQDYDFSSVLTGDDENPYDCSDFDDIEEIAFLPSTLRAIHNQDYVGAQENVMDSFYSSMYPFQTLIETRDDALWELYREGLCADTSYYGGAATCKVQLDNTLLSMVVSDVQDFPGEPEEPYDGPLAPYSDGGLHMLVFDPLQDDIPNFDSTDPHDRDDTGQYDTLELEQDHDFPDALPLWEPGRPRG